ncbi:thioredoxin family protein [Candidatus Uhrbacteria bacterium]|nr:thioredoxin family protein [Candidatus Uhrbacteria bacterium]
MKYFFYGDECPHCHVMMPLVDKLIAEGVEITKLETWHHPENAKIFDQKDGGKCGGVPFFFNEETGKSICGEASEDEVRKWAS